MKHLIIKLTAIGLASSLVACSESTNFSSGPAKPRQMSAPAVGKPSVAQTSDAVPKLDSESKGQEATPTPETDNAPLGKADPSTPTPEPGTTPAPSVTPSSSSTETPASTPAPTPVPTDVPEKFEFGTLWSAGDDGTYFYLNLDTGRWMWENMTVYNPSYDSNYCQDYVALNGALNITNAGGAVVTANVNMDWRFNPNCPTRPKTFAGNATMPGRWGTFVNFKSATVTNLGGGGTMTITQVDRTLRFQVVNTLSARVVIEFSH